MRNYSVFAKYYDQLTANIDYHKRAEYFNQIIQKYKTTPNNLLLDLGCGTGSLSEAFAKLDFDVIGVDNSMEMLSVAMDKKFDSNLSIQYLCQDMREIDMFGTIDITICALDSLNHLDSLSDIKKVFKKVALFSEPNGLFIFDMNTIYKHKFVLANNTFTYETDEVFCVWENTLNDKDNEISINLEFFEREDNCYYRSSENFSEKAYSLEEITDALKENNLKLIAVYDDDSFNPPNETSQRLVYIAKSIKEIL